MLCAVNRNRWVTWDEMTNAHIQHVFFNYSNEIPKDIRIKGVSWFVTNKRIKYDEEFCCYHLLNINKALIS